MPLPDLLACLIVHTQSLPASSALSGGRISGGRARTRDANDPTGWAMPTYAIVFQLVSGPAIARRGRVPWKSQNIQIDCYGPDLRTAGDLYRTLYSELYPSDVTTPSGFIAAHCAVGSLEELSSPIALFGGENIWPKIVSTHLVRYSEIQV